ncbi:MAG: ABC transporter ATP-binding protein/permease [Bacteroidales bacterium]|nr:ABC transporter ATP-binding protein/permease [Bacteroidales bacterium]
MKDYWKILKTYKRYIILSPILVFGFVLCETLQPTLMADVIDNGVMKGDMPRIFKVGGIMVALSVLGIIFSVSNVYCASKTGTGFATDIRKALFSKIQKMSFSDIDSFGSESLIIRMTNDTTMLQQVIIRIMMVLYRAPLMMILAFFFIIRINPQIALYIGLAIPILAIAVAILMRKAYPLFSSVQKKLDNLNRIIRENLINIRVVKSFVREDYEKEKFQEANLEYRDNFIKALDLIVMAMPVMQFIMNALVIAILWVGGSRQMQIGGLISMLNYTMQILMALMFVSMTLVMMVRASASSTRIREIMHKEVSISDSQNCAVDKYKVNSGSIEFKNVCFKYNKDSENFVLKNINLKINNGDKVAIAGATGSSKSTLLHLIPRLYDITSGEIIIGGRDIKDYSLHELRESIGMVLQKNELFSGTIASNLRWGNENASMEELEEVSKIAEAHDFIMSFPEGYETILGQSGVNISGGQKQRLCIARAILKKPKILILDNSTSAVDTDTESKIMNNLKNYLTDTTVLMVTQRYSSMSSCDYVVVLDDGQIESIGKPNELLEKSEIFNEIFTSQQLMIS